MRGTIPALLNMPSWHGAWLKHRDIFTFAFTFCSLLSSIARNKESWFQRSVTLIAVVMGTANLPDNG
jgi:hypothetical protein